MIKAEDQEKATSRPAFVHSNRDFSSSLRAGGYQISGQHYYFLEWPSWQIRSQELADEMADGWDHLMTHFLIVRMLPLHFFNELLHRAALMTLM